jgi:hypothetical protein
MKKLEELNGSCVVKQVDGNLFERLAAFEVLFDTPDQKKEIFEYSGASAAVIMTEAASFQQINEVNNWCRSTNRSIRFILALSRGVLGSVFCDFGDKYTVDEIIDCHDHHLVESVTQVFYFFINFVGQTSCGNLG